MSVHKRGREKGRSNWAVKLWLISGQVNCWAKLLSNALKVIPEVTIMFVTLLLKINIKSMSMTLLPTLRITL